ncbi:tyrosine-protein phosphatase [Amycolatopsis echigonensis]|uniref:Tyrosine-protein phosphatase n=1 Tax=Amycolatopsis echigonensis TaxID=2576905 RepID=A0A8E2B512_9PSEU|nr:tyrosine-protein phosphatase [Amycolatopsis echigonensis]MBB2502364.1 tyrosine-protein phosphatase [Amycolatopsis echigonensis]
MTDAQAVRSLVNFRDLGGLRTGDGREIRRGVLYRSDNPHLADDADVRLLTAEYRVADVIDLRSRRELDAEGWHAGFSPAARVHHFPIAGGPGTAIEAAPTGERLAARYLEYLDDYAPSVVGAVETVASGAEGAVVVHCRAGKDRTGVVIAMILEAVGVREEDIVADFARTTAAMKQIMAALRASPTYAANTARLPEEMYRSDAPTMSAFLAKLRGRGGAAQWLTEHGMSTTAVGALTDRLVG